MTIRQDDHAFASGPVFRKPRGLLRSALALGNFSDARCLIRVWQQFEVNSVLGENVQFGLNARIVNLGAREAVRIGSGSVIRGILRNEAGGKITLADDVYIGDDVIISSATEVTIGSNSLLAHGVQIFDNDTHPVDPAERVLHYRMIRGLGPPHPLKIGKAPVVVGTACWVGMNSLIMKGVSIGEGTIVAAGSVVTESLPPMVVAGGNPARVAREIDGRA